MDAVVQLARETVVEGRPFAAPANTTRDTAVMQEMLARMRAAADYINATIHNSGVLLQVGQAAALSTEPSVAASGKELIQIALRLRILALLALAKVYLRILMPGAPLSVGRLAERYHDATGLAARLLLLQKLRTA